MSDATKVAEPPAAVEGKPKGELIHRAKYGAISAALFRRDAQPTDGTTFDSFSITVDRTYKAKDGKYQTTNYYRPQDILAVQETLMDCYKACYEQTPAEESEA